ncbi:MAG TPA: MmcQ/YjbR family DNA-binding protein [Steroidobacteraceae bacterium]|nr:MmcQ/YjbR family DNA-binding protein [Steroidobacteraceae bacterium]
MPAAIATGYDRFLRIALAMPGAEASTSYGTPAVKVRGKLMSRWRTEAEGALAIRCDFLDRQILLLAQPDVFLLTDHYRDYPWILMRMEKASRTVMAEAVDRAWRLVAPAKLVKQRDEPASPEKDPR